jgi:hypothetical protein
MRSPSPQYLRALRHALLPLYPTEQDVRRLVADSGLQASRIAMHGQSKETAMFAVLDEAQKQERLDDLLTIVHGDHPGVLLPEDER